MFVDWEGGWETLASSFFGGTDHIRSVRFDCCLKLHLAVHCAFVRFGFGAFRFSLPHTIVIELAHSTSTADEDYGQFVYKNAEGEWRSPITVIRRPCDDNEAWCWWLIKPIALRLLKEAKEMREAAATDATIWRVVGKKGRVVGYLQEVEAVMEVQMPVVREYSAVVSNCPP